MSTPDWRELLRRCYVELFHCDQQMTQTLDENNEPMWHTGSTVRDILRDARAALEAYPAAASAQQDERECAKCEKKLMRYELVCLSCASMKRGNGNV